MSDVALSSFQLQGILVSVAIGLVYAYSTWAYQSFKKLGVKGPKPWPFVGNMMALFRKPITDIDFELSAKYGKVYGVFYGRTPFLIVSNLDMVKEITVKSFSHFVNQPTMGIRQPKPFDRMLTTISDDHWRHVRSTLSPTFTSGKLKQMLPMIEDCGMSLVEYLDSNNSRSPPPAKKIMSAFTIDVIAGTAFGLKVDSLRNQHHPFLKHAEHFFSTATELTIKRYLLLTIFLTFPKLGEFLMNRGLTVFDTKSVNYIEAVVQKTLEGRTEPSERNDFVQLCVDHHVEVDVNDKSTMRETAGLLWTTKGLTSGDILSNAMVFLLAGHETTGSFLTFFLYSMATWPDVQEKLYEEIAAFIGQGQGEADYESLKGLVYMDQCFDEVLRMYPPVSRLNRQCNEEITVGGVCIPKGMVVAVPVHAIHYDPVQWPDPYEFRPERFEAAEKEKRHACAWLPFGFGPRNCIGMRLALLEAKVAALKTLQKYRIYRVPETPAHPLKWKVMTGLLTPEKPIVLGFDKRVE